MNWDIKADPAYKGWKGSLASRGKGICKASELQRSVTSWQGQGGQNQVSEEESPVGVERGKGQAMASIQCKASVGS